MAYLLVLLFTYPDGATFAEVLDSGLSLEDCLEAASFPAPAGYNLVCEEEQ